MVPLLSPLNSLILVLAGASFIPACSKMVLDEVCLRLPEIASIFMVLLIIILRLL
jgi:hypothetical protein